MAESTTVSEKVPTPSVSKATKKTSPPAAKKEEPVKEPVKKAETKRSHTFKGKNAYLCYKDTVFKTLITENKGKTHKEIMALVGEKWKSMSDEDKKPYVEMSKADI